MILNDKDCEKITIKKLQNPKNSNKKNTDEI